MALLLHCSSSPHCPSSLAGGALWGEQGSLNLYDETGVEHEKTSAVHGPQPWPPEEHKVLFNF